MQDRSIITVGFCPAWDIACYAEALDWGDHKQLQHQTITPAGKALNVSRALAWMGIQNTAAGLWGQDDYALLQTQFADSLVDLRMTLACGRTRQNITIADTKTNREMHLRAPCALASPESLDRLAQSLASLIRPGDVVIFSGALPPIEYEDLVFAIFSTVVEKNAHIVLDTSSPMYGTVVQSFPVALIKPNLEELRQLLKQPVNDSTDEIVEAARQLCGQVKFVAVSRGVKGAVLVTKDAAFSCSAVTRMQTDFQTVGCGDFLLAGLLADWEHAAPETSLATGVKVAAARAWGLYPETSWRDTANRIQVSVRQL